MGAGAPRAEKLFKSISRQSKAASLKGNPRELTEVSDRGERDANSYGVSD